MAEGTEEANTAGHRYEAVARALEEAIEAGVHGPGDRLPGVRKLAAQFGVSVSTVVAAEHLLEDRGLIEARPRSGYYVRRHPWQPPERPATSAPEGEPVPVTGQALVLRVVQAASEPDRSCRGHRNGVHEDFLPKILSFIELEGLA